MEGVHHQSPAWVLPSSDSDTFNEYIWNCVPENLDDNYMTGNLAHFSAPDSLTQQISATGWDFNDLGPQDYIPDLSPSEFGPAIMPDITSPVSSGGTTWGSSLDFDFNSPTIDVMSQFATGQPNNAFMEGDFAIEVPSIAPWDTVQKSPTQATAGPGNLTMEDRRPLRVSAREWRKIIRPEKCPACGKGHTYPNELAKHIAARHRDLAPEHGVSTDRHFCMWCDKSFARRDHLTRHLVAKHGRPRKKRKRG